MTRSGEGGDNEMILETRDHYIPLGPATHVLISSAAQVEMAPSRYSDAYVLTLRDDAGRYIGVAGVMVADLAALIKW